MNLKHSENKKNDSSVEIYSRVKKGFHFIQLLKVGNILLLKIVSIASGLLWLWFQTETPIYEYHLQAKS